MLVLDSGGVTRLAERSTRSLALIAALRREGLWPALVPSVVLVESLHGRADRDANTARFLKICSIDERVSETRARRAAALRTQARRGSAVDAVVVATAEPGGTVLTGDIDDIQALARHAESVHVERA